MKRIHFLPLLLFALGASAQWNLNYSQSSKVFRGIQFLNNQVGYAIGDIPDSSNAFVLRTGNGGQTWQQLALPSNFGYIHRLAFYNDSSGYVIAAGAPVVVGHTTNRGQSWTINVLDSAYFVTGMSCVNDSTVFYLNNEGRLRRMNTYGSSYNYLCDTLPDWGLLLFPDGVNGYAAQGHHVLRSNSAGNSWFYLPTGLAQPMASWAMAFSSWNTGFASTINTAGPNIYRTGDAAQSWQQSGTYNAAVMAAKGSSCVAVNNSTVPAIVYTKNDGFTWLQDPLPPNFSGATAGAITANGIAWLIHEGTIFRRDLSVFANYNVTAVAQQEADTRFSLYPNPVGEVLHIHAPEGCVVRITDVLGKLMHVGEAGEINVSAFEKGIYFVNIYNQSGISTTRRFVKE